MFAISKAMAREELEKIRSALANNSPQDLAKKVKEELNLLSSTTLDIAITGVTGVGKSSLVNALRGMGDYANGSAKIGNEQTTMEPEKYPHPVFSNVTLWDLPGIGTPDFKAHEYPKKTNFARYDFFIIVGERFTENDVLLSQKIQKMRKKYYFVRSKVDQSIASERRNPDFCEEKSLEAMREYCCENLRKAGESKPQVFLLSSWELREYDFPAFQDTLEKELDGLKRQVLIESMPAFSKAVLDKKKAAMEAHIWKVAIMSCAIGAIPFPGLSLPCDISILVLILGKFCKVFGLDEESLGVLAQRINKPIDELKSAIKKAPLANQITTEFVLDLIIKSGTCGVVMAAEFYLKVIPVLGSLVGGATSFVTVFYMLKNFLSDVKEDAENVLAKAVELQEK